MMFALSSKNRCPTLLRGYVTEQFLGSSTIRAINVTGEIYSGNLFVLILCIPNNSPFFTSNKEITGTDSGLVRSAVDQLIEELGIMAQKNEKQKVYVAGGHSSEILKTPWHTTASITKDKSPVECLAIRFSKVFPEFKEYAKRTNYEGDLLDKESYMKMFDECEYIVEKSHVVDYEGKKYKNLCINTEKAKKPVSTWKGSVLNNVTSGYLIVTALR
jgi:hypothetical protein